MPKPGKADITIVLDRSGSMFSVAADTIGGFNAFLKSQQEEPGECALTLVQFDHVYEFVHTGKPVAEVPPLDDTTFVPRGSTALLDAIGRAINETGARLAALPEGERPERVIVVILTDGHENVSREFSRETVFEMIAHQRDVYSWQFLFLGAGQDAIESGAGLGISADHSLSVAKSGAAYLASFEATGHLIREYRRSGDAEKFVWPDGARQAQRDLGAAP